MMIVDNTKGEPITSEFSNMEHRAFRFRIQSVLWLNMHHLAPVIVVAVVAVAVAVVLPQIQHQLPSIRHSIQHLQLLPSLP
jgi:NADH:ubiquinone oxidoreductase subunit D